MYGAYNIHDMFNHQGRIQNLKKEEAQVAWGEFLGIFRPI